MAPEVLAIVGVFVTIAIVVGATASWAFAWSTPERKRLRAIAQPSASSPLITGEARLIDRPDPVLVKLSRLVPKSPKEMSKLQRRLTRAGYPFFGHVLLYSVAEVALPVGLFVATVALLGFSGGLAPGLFLAALGYVAPSFFVNYKAKNRERAIRNGLPDALDLLTVCVESGSGLDQAIAKAGDELQISHPLLAAELTLVTTEIRAGKPRMEAFRNFASRSGVDEVRTLVGMLVQTDRFGTSVADALRVHADTSRTKRRQLAEERAGKVGVKLVFPLALCLFPALYIVCFGPVVIRIYRALFEGQP